MSEKITMSVLDAALLGGIEIFKQTVSNMDENITLEELEIYEKQLSILKDYLVKKINLIKKIL